MLSRYQYHLGFALPRARCDQLAKFLAALNKSAKSKTSAPKKPHKLAPKPLYLSLITLAETPLPHPFLRQRCTAAFANPLPPAIDFRFRTITGTGHDLRQTAAGNMAETNDLIDALTIVLAPQGVQPIPRRPSARPTISIGSGPQPSAPHPYLWSWTPQTLSLIEEDSFTGTRRELCTAKLAPPTQPAFNFGKISAAA